MNFSALSQNDRIALVAGAVVALSGLLSIFYQWGAVMLVSALAGLLAVAVIIQPSLVAALRISGSKGSLLMIAGVGATLVNVLRGLDAVTWLLEHLISLDAIQFIVGIVAAIVLLYAGWMANRGASSPAAAMPAAAAPSAPPAVEPAAPPPPPAAEPPAVG
jgi:hypothetical protein